MGRAESARRERPSHRLSFRPRRPAGPAAPSPASFASRFGLPACLLALFTALAAGPAAAQTTITLVSNTDRSSHGAGDLADSDQAQAFTTGGNSAGYTLTRVDVRFNSVDSPNASYAVSIRTNDSGSPGALVGDLTGPGTLATGINAFTTAGIDLAGGTTYFLVLNSSSAANNSTDSTVDDREGGQSGWRIANGSLYRDRETTGGWTDTGFIKIIAVKGYAKTGTLSTDPVWSTTMTVAAVSASTGTSGMARGYDAFNNSTISMMAENMFEANSTATETGTYTVVMLGAGFIQADDGVVLWISGPAGVRGLHDAGQYTLEFAGETFPLSDATDSSGGFGQYFQFNQAWLTTNASSLNLANFETTLPVGAEVPACLRTADQVCPGGTVTPSSSDATLSSLTLSGVTLEPTFVSGTETYTATVANSVTATTVTPIRSHSGATDGVTDGDGNVLTNPVSLAVGDNVIIVTVTAEDTTTIKTYMVTVTREAATSSDLPWSTTMTAEEGTSSKRGYHFTGFGSLDDDDFTVGTADYEVQRLFRGMHTLTFNLTAALSDKDDYILEWAGEVLPLSATTTSSIQFFTWEQSWLATNAPSLSTADYATTLADGLKVQACLRTADQVCPGGTVTPSSDATLSALTVNDGTSDHTIDLATTPYTVTVANGVETVTLTAPPATGAAVTAVTLGGNTIADTDYSDGITVPNLAVGDNVIVVTVTAEDGTTTQTYTVTVTQNAATSSDLPWSTTMTVAEGTASKRGYHSTGFGSLEADNFTVGTVDYEVLRLMRRVDLLSLALSEELSDKDDYILEWAGEELPLSASSSSSNISFHWNESWLATNAPSLSTADYATTLADGIEVQACLRTTMQTCPGGTVTNNPPVFADNDGTDDGMLAREVDENSPLGTNIGAPVTAMDPDTSDTLTYSLDPNPIYTFTDRFQIDSATGQLKTDYLFDHELGANSLDIAVVANDSRGGTDTIIVNVTITDVPEPPDPPVGVTVSVTEIGSADLEVGWTAPSNVGRPDILHYDVQYRELGASQWTDGPQDVTGTSATIPSVDRTKFYEAQVRATNDEGDSDWTVSDTVPVTIESEHESIGAGLEDLNFTLTRGGDTTEELEATVTITQDQTWLGSTDLSHTVTFAAGSATATLSIGATNFSFTPATTGNLTATVSGDGISGGEDTVSIISIAEPPFTVTYDMPAYTFPEHQYTNIYIVSTLNGAYPRAPSRELFLSYSSWADTAAHNEATPDYNAVSWQTGIDSGLYELDDGLFVARLSLSGNNFTILDDDIYEGPERFGLVIERSANTPAGIAQLRQPDSTLCTLGVDCPNTPVRFWVNITDEDDLPMLSLTAAPASIAEEDDDSTTAIAENVSTVLVEITNDKTFAEDQTVTLTFSGGTEGTHYSLSPADADLNTVGHQVVLPADDGDLSDDDLSVEVTVTAVGNDTTDGHVTLTVTGDHDGTAIGTANITIRDDETATITAPVIDDVQVTSTATTDNTYGLNETIEITVTFDSAVTVDTTGGTPHIQFVLNGTGSAVFKSAEYDRGSGSTALVFDYDVQLGDKDDDGIWLRENHLELQGGTIQATADNTVAATLTYAGPGTQSEHKVDGSTVPDAPTGLSATANGTTAINLTWDAPANTGGAPITGYRIEVSSDSGSSWTNLKANTNSTSTDYSHTGLSAGATRHYRVSAINSAGAGAASDVDDATTGTDTNKRPLVLTVEPVKATVTEGEPVRYRIKMSRRTSGAVVESVYWYKGDFVRSSYSRVTSGINSKLASDDGLSWVVSYDTLDDVVEEADGKFTVTIRKPDSDCSGCVDQYADGEPYTVGKPSRATVTILDNDGAGSPPPSSPPIMSADDAKVEEGPGAELVFTVKLDRSPVETAEVDWETVEVTTSAGATEGEDYVGASGTLEFRSGQTSKEIRVEVLDDSHDEGKEVILLILSGAENAVLDDTVFKGTILNSDPMPAAWLTRFGRTASDHVVDAIAERWRDGEIQTQQTHFTLGGRNVDKQFGRWDGNGGVLESSGAGPDDPALEDESAWARMDRFKAGALAGPEGVGPAGGNAAGSGLKGADKAGRSPAGGGLGGEGLAGRGPAGGGRSGGDAARSALMNSLGLPSGNLRDLLMGSSFFYSRTLEGNGEQSVQPGWLGQWSAWGRTAATRFSGADGALSLNGEVATAILGADARRGRWLMGVTLSRSEGDGVYTHPTAAGGAVGSTLTSLNPYVHYRLNERTSLWGVAGYGLGGLKLTLDGSETGIETDLATAMAAFGGRGVFSVRTSRLGAYELAVVSDVRVNRTESDSVENLMGAAGATSRVRVMLEGSGSMPLATGGVLTPTLEAGLRYDGGDAETGGGLEVGAGLGYAAGALAVEVKGRMLLAHGATDYEEQGFSGSLRYRPRADGRGLSINLGSAWGATQSGVQSLWSQQDASGLARGAAMNAGQRFQAELGYGIAGRGRADALWIPFLGAEMGAGGAQSLRMGVTFTSGLKVQAGLELGQLENGQGEREHAVLLRGTLRW